MTDLDLTPELEADEQEPSQAKEILHTDNLVKAYRGRRVVDQVNLSVQIGRAHV